ncbi:hypothetical protein OPT61_g1991 [Boeremia exigua]|uniref:Uncharacterized protein n=1 Tax=Boeremia exigua TaxID=749465 RepID=A0ACC2IN54_9PLEO|nr:hypothetical protein OPT61_g1991 [Boeremia exigua]
MIHPDGQNAHFEQGEITRKCEAQALPVGHNVTSLQGKKKVMQADTRSRQQPMLKDAGANHGCECGLGQQTLAMLLPRLGRTSTAMAREGLRTQKHKSSLYNPSMASLNYFPPVCGHTNVHLKGVPSMLTATHDNHSRVRRLFSPAFSDRALKKQEPLFKRYVNILLQRLDEMAEAEKPAEMTQLFNFATFDTMAQLCFGHSLGLLEKNELSPWVRSVFESLKMLPFASMIAYYPLLNGIFTRFEPKWVTAQREAHCQHSADRVNQRLEEGSDQPDIWNLVISAQETSNALSLEEMHSNAELFMLAGSETTATLLSGLVFYLMSQPEKWEKLTQEIRTAFSKTDDLYFESLAECKYLSACLKEALRVYPPVPIGSPRVIPANGQPILGKWIPENTRVSVHHYSTYHSATNFRDPDEFVPERWLGDVRYADDVQEAHQPFGWGHRNCLGQNMAMHEMRLIFAAVVLRFDLQLCDESRNWLHQDAYALWMKNPLLCKVTRVSA